MKILPKLLCSECSKEAKITTLFLRNCYCSATCLAEGQLKLAKWLLRMKAEAYATLQLYPGLDDDQTLQIIGLKP
jgi:hypothetical protein